LADNVHDLHTTFVEQSALTQSLKPADRIWPIRRVIRCNRHEAHNMSMIDIPDLRKETSC